MQEKLLFVSTDKVDLPAAEIRRVRNPDYVQNLTESIRHHGILQPILVERRGDRYEVIAGSTRTLIAKQIHLSEVPVMVRDTKPGESDVLRLVENLERDNPDPVSEAAYITKFLLKSKIAPAELARLLNRSEQWVRDRIAIAEMPNYMQEFLVAKELSLGVALELNQIDDEKVKRDWTYAAVNDGMSVNGAKNARRQYYGLKRAQESAKSPEEAPEVPSTPPVILFKCAKCGEMMRAEDSVVVRIHRGGCPIERGTSPDPH